MAIYRNIRRSIDCGSTDAFVAQHTLAVWLGGSSRILVASVQNGGFPEASTPASNGSPKSSLGGATFVETARTIGAPLARYWRAIDRNIPSQVASPQSLSRFFPALTRVPRFNVCCQIMGRRSGCLQKSTALFRGRKTEIEPHPCH